VERISSHKKLLITGDALFITPQSYCWEAHSLRANTSPLGAG